MSALLEERAKRRQYNSGKTQENSGVHRTDDESKAANLKSLVESVKRKNVMSDEKRGKRRKL